MTLMIAVKTTEPTVRINIIQTTNLVIFEKVLVCLLSRIIFTSKFFSYLQFTSFYFYSQEVRL